jgi:hypothetical protein
MNFNGCIDNGLADFIFCHLTRKVAVLTQRRKGAKEQRRPKSLPKRMGTKNQPDTLEEGAVFSRATLKILALSAQIGRK